MEISDNRTVINNTYKLLFPILRLYGKEYVRKISTLYKQGVFIDDMRCFRDKHIDYLHIVINIPLTVEKHGYSVLCEIMRWFRQQNYLEKDYIISVNRRNKTPVHVVLMIELPKKYQKCVDKFIKGETDMFSKSDVEKCFQDITTTNKEFFSYCRNILMTKRKIKINLNEEVLNY